MLSNNTRFFQMTNQDVSQLRSLDPSFNQPIAQVVFQSRDQFVNHLSDVFSASEIRSLY